MSIYTEETEKKMTQKRKETSNHEADCQLMTGDCSYCTCGKGYPKQTPDRPLTVAELKATFAAEDESRTLRETKGR